MITCKCNKKYIGRTNNLQRRMTEHKSRSEDPKCNSYNSKKYEHIRKCGGWCNVKMENIFYFDNKKDRNRVEKKFIRRYNTVHEGLNSCY